MKELFRKFAVAYFTGAVGALAAAAVSWALGAWGVYRALAVHLAPAVLTWTGLYPRLMAGSVWALSLVPLAMLVRARGLGLGLLLSLIPSAYLLLIKYPAQGAGLLGASKGPLLFIVILALNVVWGVVAGVLYDQYYRS